MSDSALMMAAEGWSEVRGGLLWKWGALFAALAFMAFHAREGGLFHDAWVLPVLLAWFACSVVYTSLLMGRMRAGVTVPGRLLTIASYLSFAVDLAAVSYLIYNRGAHSGYAVLYPLVIISFSTLCPSRRCFYAAGATALASYGAVGYLTRGVRFLGEEMFWTHVAFVAAFLFSSHRFHELMQRHTRLAQIKNELEASTQELSATNELLSELSFRDALTGLYNHRFFYHRLTEEVKRAEITGQPLALLMLDIDFFKLYNDTHGHVRGDEVLKEVARLIREQCRETDLVCRYGGEEFAVILPGTGAEAAAAVGDRIRRAVAEHPFPGRETQPGRRLTVSLGAAVYPTDASSVGDLVDRADQALYRAKHRGRNTVQRFFCLGGQEVEQAEAGQMLDAELRQTVQSLLAVVNARDRYTYGHAERTAEYAGALASRLGLDPAEARLVRYAGWVHDLGLIEVSGNLLTKQGPLSESEKAALRQHTLFGVSLIEPLFNVEALAAMVRHHHERWDGGGYPDGLAGEAIPLGARVIAVAESFDAMLQARPYRPAMTPEEAVAELRRGAGTQFDPRVVETFIAMLEEMSANRSSCPLPWAASGLR